MPSSELGKINLGPWGNLCTLDVYIKEINKNTYSSRGPTHHQFHRFHQDMFAHPCGHHLPRCSGDTYLNLDGARM